VIVGEPTSLQLAIKHKGFALIQIDVKGRAAHGSIPEEGIDAIDKMAKLIVELSNLKKAFNAIRNEMLGSPKIHMSMIEGGREWSVVPDNCTLKLEARTIPEYTSSEVMEDINKIIEKLSHEDQDFKANVNLCLAGEPLNTSSEEPLVKTIRSAIRTVKGEEPQILGMPFYTEAAIYAAELGVPAVLIGPGDIRQAHACDEFVEIDDVVKASAIYYLIAREFVNAQ
jgi:acetylornithine deacetylase/succinyl-diaminopimelate desuccinylase-like protein